ncbi:GNAT family N-acetyltransferase [Paenibacillus alkaliterrae]|uniref:GNAT family N-acetyltransferase n=1 Tax=Paenibacillus alkaliterrae TaxID=320909 RepID=UPI001F247B11|nr:GNAT family N-acetyltransferase [Paenibacillus alkaliterrae]MCF2941192.1 GNAT family N-acetyltransferase [Paenibacillus alkaliterrae]
MNKNEVVIKQLEKEQFDESMALSQFAFQYKRTAEELEHTKKQLEAEPAVRWAAYIDDQLAAQATVLELETYINGKRFAMGGIAGVATWPEYRRQGLVAKLLVHSLMEMKEKGQSISFLHPFAFGFYRKFGWETYTEHKAYTIKVELLPTRNTYVGRVEKYTGSYDFLDAIYEAYASHYNGSLVRSELWWKYRISKRKPGQIAVYYDKQNQAIGYIIYEVKDMVLRVHELIYLNEEAKAALWSFIGQHDSMINEVTITAPSDDLLPFSLTNPRIKQEIIPYFMARIVDVEAFVKHYEFLSSTEEDRLQIEIKDEHAEWNSGCYLLRIEASGNASLQRLDNMGDSSATIKMDIGSLTCMLLGYLRPLQFAQLARIDGDTHAIKRLQDRIPERTTYLPDFF